MKQRELIAMVFKSNESDNNEIWVPEIDPYEPLLKILLEKYRNDGYSVTGDTQVISEELQKLL